MIYMCYTYCKLAHVILSVSGCWRGDQHRPLLKCKSLFCFCAFFRTNEASRSVSLVASLVLLRREEATRERRWQACTGHGDMPQGRPATTQTRSVRLLRGRTEGRAARIPVIQPENARVEPFRGETRQEGLG